MNTGYEGILQFRGKWRDYQERVLLHAQQYLKDGKYILWQRRVPARLHLE